LIIIRTPICCSFCGGGSDLPAFYRKHGGTVLAAGLNRYIYISIHPHFHKNKTLCKYSKIELVNEASEIKHPILRTLLQRFSLNGVDITSTADIPESSGLGFSSSFTVGLLHAIHKYKGDTVTSGMLASEACHIELGILREPMGKQDQYAAAFGGLHIYHFQKNGDVRAEPVKIPGDKEADLEGSLLLFYTGDSRPASKALKKHARDIHTNTDKEKIQILIRNMAIELHKELLNGNIDAMGHVLHASWEQKRKLIEGVSNPNIDSVYEKALSAGAAGGILLGAGSGGFLLLYAPKSKHTDIKNALCRLRHIPFAFSGSGSAVIYS